MPKISEHAQNIPEADDRRRTFVFAHWKYPFALKPSQCQNLKVPGNDVTQEKSRSDWPLIPSEGFLFLYST